MTDAESRIAALEEANRKLREMVCSLAARCHAQSELLAQAAARKQSLPPDAAELAAALAPFAAHLAGGWDRGELPATALYPVRIGDLRRASRLLAKLKERSQAA